MILNLYKPKTWTSFDVVAKVRGILHEKKVGHAGTLDPLAEGVLLILTGTDCKLQDSLMKGEKQYLAEISFGIDSPTYDLEYTPTITTLYEQKDLDKLSENISSVLPSFLGESDQTVPIYSAKMVDGKRLYKHARSNTDFDLKNLPKNHINIYSLRSSSFYMKSIETDQGIKDIPTLEIYIDCSHGTYIRSLAHDLGLKINTTALLSKLVRTKIGDYNVEDSIQITDLSNRLSLQ